MFGTQIYYSMEEQNSWQVSFNVLCFSSPSCCLRTHHFWGWVLREDRRKAPHGRQGTLFHQCNRLRTRLHALAISLRNVSTTTVMLIWIKMFSERKLKSDLADRFDNKGRLCQLGKYGHYFPKMGWTKSVVLKSCCNIVHS